MGTGCLPRALPISTFPVLIKSFTLLRVVVRVARDFDIKFENPPDRTYGLSFDVQGYRLNLLLKARGGNIHIFVLTYDEEMQ